MRGARSRRRERLQQAIARPGLRLAGLRLGIGVDAGSVLRAGVVPLAHALIKQGLSSSAGMVLLLIGPITSYATILVLRKEFGTRILLTYLALVVFLSVGLGIGYSVITR